MMTRSGASPCNRRRSLARIPHRPWPLAVLHASIYRRLPVPLQSVACSVAGRRLSARLRDRRFREALDRHCGRERLPPDELAALRDERLRACVLHAAETVPYYERLFAAQRIDPRSIRTLADLESLPILTAAAVAAEPRAFVSRAVRAAECVATGDGGLPATRAAASEALLTQWRFRRRHGIEPGTWCALFGGRNVVPQRQERPPYWRVNWPGRQVIFSPYHLSEQTVEAYVDALNDYQCPWMHGLPSVIGTLAGLMSAAELTLASPLVWITTHAEQLSGIHRRGIRRAFGTIPKQCYAAAHAVATIAEGRDGRLVVDEDHAAVEFLPTAERGVFRVVGTNVSNPAAPLIRFDTGDLVTRPLHASDAQLPRVVSACAGASRDLVVLPSGARIGRLERMFDDLPAVRAVQIVQHADLTIDIDVLMAPGFGTAEDRGVRERIAARLGDATWRVAYVDRLPAGMAGKLQLVVSQADHTSRAVVQPDTETVSIE